MNGKTHYNGQQVLKWSPTRIRLTLSFPAFDRLSRSKIPFTLQLRQEGLGSHLSRFMRLSLQ